MWGEEKYPTSVPLDVLCDLKYVCVLGSTGALRSPCEGQSPGAQTREKAETSS